MNTSFILLIDGFVFCSSGGKSVGEVPENSSVIYEIELVKVKAPFGLPYNPHYLAYFFNKNSIFLS